MSAIDDTNKALKSLRYLPTYTLRAVRRFCPVDNNVDVPENQRLRGSFQNKRIDENAHVIESNSPYLKYVVMGRGAVFPKGPPNGAKHLKWRAGVHGSPPVYPQKTRIYPDGSRAKHKASDGYFYSGYASPSKANPFVDRAYKYVLDHIQNRSLKEIASELETAKNTITSDYNGASYATGIDVSWEE